MGRAVVGWGVCSLWQREFVLITGASDGAMHPELMTDPHMSPYAGRQAVLATMHRKEAVIAPPLLDRLGLSIVVPQRIDTDALGTFSGEVPRRGTMKETAVAKARLGMAASGLDIGLASEGSYGPHPWIPFIPGGIELLVLVDAERGIVVSEQLVVDETNFGHVVTDNAHDISEFLSQVGFPDHGLVVGPNAPGSSPQFAKGIRTRSELDEAIRTSAATSTDGRALLQADMRAHQNPTRMRAIAKIAERLSQRLIVLCPGCRTPGFGLVDVVKGLLCEACGTPSDVAKNEVFGCPACEYKELRPRSDGRTFVEPGECSLCNP